jgi:hypothetical protein
MRLVIVAFAILLASCSSVQTTKNPQVTSIASLGSSEPFSIAVSASTPQLERLLKEYVLEEFGRSITVTEAANGRGLIDVTYASSGQGNGLADWQNSTLLVVMRTPGGQRLWSGEYAYKGGMEVSGFKVATREEAAKLVVHRLAEKFASDMR